MVLAVKIIKIGWIILASAALFTTLYMYYDTHSSDVGIIIVWSMLILSFPISNLCFLILGGLEYALDEIADITVSTTYASLVIFWILLFVAGYWQWFILTPKLVAKLRDLLGRYRDKA